MRKKLKKLNNKGMTLVEIIVGLLVSSIIVTTATSLLFMSSNITKGTQNSNIAKIVGDSVVSYIDSQLQFAHKVEIRTTASSTIGSKYLKASDGVLQLNNTNVYDESFYSGYHIELSVQALENNVVAVYVSVLDKAGNVVYKNEKVIKIVNASLNNFKITPTAKITNPYLFFENAASAEKDLFGLMRLQFLNTFKASQANNGMLPNDWIELGLKNGYVSNDSLREYVVKKHYGGQFPVLDAKEIAKSSDLIKAANGKVLYVQAYIYPFSMKDTPTITFYANAQTVSQWYVSLIFDSDENKWYTGPAFSIAGNTWAENKALMARYNWKEVLYDIK